MTVPFEYPLAAHLRRHGPMGYADYEEYRDWLRDEFAFRCVYCLTRETWGRRKGRFHIDHFIAASTAPTLETEYDNLLYACDTCNTVKNAIPTPNPLTELLATAVTVHPDGRLETHSTEARRLVRKMQLDTEEARAERKLVILAVQLVLQHEAESLPLWLRYPGDLPDLTRRKPPGGNSRPDGIEQSHFARRHRGELPDTY